MKDYRGMYIQQIRKEKGYSMEALSHGICSVSYLSKIENNEVSASEEIITLLLKKLDIKIVEDTKIEKIKGLLSLFFKRLFEYDVKIFDTIDELIGYDHTLFGSSVYIDYELFKRYASEICDANFNAEIDLSNYVQFMDEKQKGLYSIYLTWTQQGSKWKLDQNIQLFLLKGQAGNELKNHNLFKSYDLLRDAYMIALEKCNLVCVCDVLLDIAWTSFSDLQKVEECYFKILNISKKHFKTEIKNKYESMVYYNYSVLLLMNEKYVEAEKIFKLGFKKVKYMEDTMKQRFLERYCFCEMKLNKNVDFIDEIPSYLMNKNHLYENLKAELKKREDDIFIHYLFKEACVSTNHWKEAYEQECYFSQKMYLE